MLKSLGIFVVFSAALFSAAGYSDAESGIFIEGDSISVGDAVLGCREKQIVERMAELVSDDEAFNKFLLVAIGSGQCLPIKAGTAIVIESAHHWDGVYKFRRKGDPLSLWTARNMLVGAKKN